MESNTQDCRMPEAEIDGDFRGLVPTLNQMGFMTSELDPCSRGFIEFAPNAPGPALEIGAAYGIVTLQVLGRQTPITANDIDPRHLEILASRVPVSERQYLTLLSGAFPDLPLRPNTYGAALAARVFHFFSPVVLRRAAAALFASLVSGGKAFIVADSPYDGRAQKFGRTKLYEERLARGDEWPGFFEGIHAQVPGAQGCLPNSIHHLDPTVFRRVMEEAGFVIEAAEWIDRPDYPEGYRSKGRECAGVVARKP